MGIPDDPGGGVGFNSARIAPAKVDDVEVALASPPKWPCLRGGCWVLAATLPPSSRGAPLEPPAPKTLWIWYKPATAAVGGKRCPWDKSGGEKLNHASSTPWMYFTLGYRSETAVVHSLLFWTRLPKAAKGDRLRPPGRESSTHRMGWSQRGARDIGGPLSEGSEREKWYVDVEAGSFAVSVSLVYVAVKPVPGGRTRRTAHKDHPPPPQQRAIRAGKIEAHEGDAANAGGKAGAAT